MSMGPGVSEVERAKYRLPLDGRPFFIFHITIQKFSIDQGRAPRRKEKRKRRTERYKEKGEKRIINK